MTNLHEVSRTYGLYAHRHLRPRSPLRTGGLGLSLALLLTLSVSGCGATAKHKLNHRGRAAEEVAAAAAPTESDAPAKIPAGGRSDDISDKKPETKLDESLNFSTGALYFQRDNSLQDLFTQDVSQLCWPAALAYQIDYQKHHAKPELPKLKPLTDNASGKDGKAPDQIRYLTKLCHTDLKLGTYPSQATDCVRDYFTASGYEAEISAIGPVVGGEKFADDVGLFDREITIDDFRAHIKDGSSVVIMVGFYTQSATDSTWHRLNGHFVSLTGYDYQDKWNEDEIVLDVVNPDVDYSSRATAERFDKVTVKRLTGPDLDGIPIKGVTLGLLGPGFDRFPQIALIERLIVFKAK